MILLCETKWRDVIVPAGRLCTLRPTQTRWGDLWVTIDPCPHCGVKLNKMLPREYLDFAPGSVAGFYQEK